MSEDYAVAAMMYTMLYQHWLNAALFDVTFKLTCPHDSSGIISEIYTCTIIEIWSTNLVFLRTFPELILYIIFDT